MNWNDLPPLFPQPAPKPLLKGSIIGTMREWYKERLREGLVLVNFTKADGTERDMVCTLSPTYIALTSITTNTTLSPIQTAKSNDVCVVFDTDKQAWRSFRWDRVTAITPLNQTPK